jgi:N6-adenosine-specific RNA methylase IME4
MNVADRTLAKAARRAAKESALAAKILALPNKRYGVIVADPPWRFEPYSRETGMDRAADNHYPTQGLEAIKALDVASIAARDCVLFLWTTAPMLEQAFEVIKAWGFTYKSNLVWVKDRQATGYWARGQHEHLLIATRGSIPAPAPGTQASSIITAAKRGHSVKPDEALAIIEGYFPNVPKIELHRRGPARLGWDAWGDEVPKWDPTEGTYGPLGRAEGRGGAEATGA